MNNKDYIKYHCHYINNSPSSPDAGATYNYLMGIDNFFSVCENKTVLEIGPFVGLHTALISDYKPQHITLVEANPECNNILTRQFPDATVTTQDIFHFLEKPYKVDVVVCCGVLYHLHSPLYLLELIANRTDPEYIILESVVLKNDNSEHKFTLRTEIGTEVDNIPGNRYTLSEWKSASLNIVFSQDVFDLVMNNLGYRVVTKDYALGRFNCKSKEFANMTVYKKMIDIKKEIKNIIARKGHDDMDSFEPYLQLISGNFEDVTDKSVLEIGPFDGYHTDLMNVFGVKNITLIEPNSNACEYLKNNFDQSKHTVINDDIFNYLETDRTGQFDVVVCCGVLYHLHSPIYLLEQIVNKVNPKHLIIETLDSKERSDCPYNNLTYNFQPEIMNVPGNRYILNNNKSVQLNLSASMNLFEYCMGEMGYKIIKKTKMFELENVHSSKFHTSMVVFERID